MGLSTLLAEEIAAMALAELIAPEELSPEYIIPEAFDPRVKDAVASAVYEAAYESGVARVPKK